MNNFKDLSLNELLQSREEINRLIEQRRKEAKDSLLSEFREKAETLGVDFDELVAAAGKKRPSTKKAPKYRNPEQATETWTGTGRQPNWVKQYLANGRQLEELAISGFEGFESKMRMPLFRFLKGLGGVVTPHPCLSQGGLKIEGHRASILLRRFIGRFDGLINWWRSWRGKWIGNIKEKNNNKRFVVF